MTKTIRPIDNMQNRLYQDALAFITAMRLPENADLLAAYQSHNPSHSILTDMYYSDARRRDWMKMFHEEMPANAINAEQATRLKAIESAVDNGQHSGASWGYLMAVAKVALNAAGTRTGMYMNWIFDLEYLEPGSCILSPEELLSVQAELGSSEFVVDESDPFEGQPTYEELLPLIEENNARIAAARGGYPEDTRTN